MSDVQKSTNPNTGHGHVFPRPDGVKARCGGPGLCAECRADAARKSATGEAETTVAADDLVPTMQRALPGGAMDDSTFDAVETALDRVEAPCRSPDGTRWLTLPERVLALATELGRVPT